MGTNGPFGFDPEDLDRVIREAGEGIRDFADRIGRFVDRPETHMPGSGAFEEFARRRPRAKQETSGASGDGVWSIYTVDADGLARVEQVYATELEALRAHRNNTDPHRQVRFLPYGVTVSVLDQEHDQAADEPE